MQRSSGDFYTRRSADGALRMKIINGGEKQFRFFKVYGIIKFTLRIDFKKKRSGDL